MPKNYSQLFVLAILLFHIIITGHGFYTMFSDYSGWTIYHLRPIMQLLFTAAWAVIFFKKRWSFFLYLSMLFYELAMKLFFGKYIFGEVFGDVFFPADLIFSFIILLLYTQHFNERPAQND